MSAEGVRNERFSMSKVCRRQLAFVLFMDKAASAKQEPSAEGVRNERFRMSKVKWLSSSFSGILQIHGL